MIVGLTGRNCAGKGEVARVLVDGGFEYLSLSDELRRELSARNLKETREALIEIGSSIRRELGPDILARRVATRFTAGLNQVVDSIRHPFEAMFLRSLGNFFLILVDAPLETRFRRAQARGRVGDSLTLEAFKEAEERELKSSDPFAQQLLKTFELADFVITNDCDIETLRQRVKEAFVKVCANLERPDWDHYFMAIADVVASRSSCVKRRVAAVIVKDRRIIATGYNGTPRGITNCNEGGCERCLSLVPSGTNLGECLCSHAEENAIVHAAYHGVSLKGATLYTTFSPCIICTKMIINAGISEVVYRGAYSLSKTTLELLLEAKVRVRQI
jgi:dCMP deaminase